MHFTPEQVSVVHPRIVTVTDETGKKGILEFFLDVFFQEFERKFNVPILLLYHAILALQILIKPDLQKGRRLTSHSYFRI